MAPLSDQRKCILSIQPVSDGGGSEHALIRMLTELSTEGWECHVALPEPAALTDLYASSGSLVHIVPMARLTTSGGPRRWIRYVAGWPLSVARLAGLARRVRADVVHTNSLHSLYGWAVAALIRRPHAWHAREVVFQSKAALRLERWLARHFADRVLAVSHAVADQLDPSNSQVVYDRPDRAFAPARAGRFRAGEQIPDDVPLIGAISRIDTWKGIEVVLDAFPRIRRSRPEARLVIAGAAVPGKEPYAAELRARAAAADGVLWLGRRSDVAEVMADLDVFVQASTEPEPFGLVIVEALASGVPVVATAAGGPLEILRDIPPGSGRLIAPDDRSQLAESVLALLPPGPYGVEQRRSRQPITMPADSATFASIFDELAGRGRRTTAS